MRSTDDTTNLVAGEAISMDADITTGIKALRIKGHTVASFQARWTGTPTGAFKFRKSNFPDACSANGTVLDLTKFTNLVPPDAFTAQQPAGAASASGGVNTIGEFGFADIAGEWLLAWYDATSGAGTLTDLRGVAI